MSETSSIQETRVPDNQKKKVRIADDFLKEDTDLKLKKSQKGDLRPSRSAVDLHLLDPDHEKHIGHGRHHHHHHGHHHHKSDTPEVERSAHSAINASQDHQARPGFVRRYLKSAKSAKKLPAEENYVPLKGVNLRDVGAVTQGSMRTGAVFRSSELLSKEEMRKNGINTILDLRRMDRPCKKGKKKVESTSTIVKYVLWGPSKIIPEKRLIPAHRAKPSPCEVCHKLAEDRYDREITVIHADLIPTTVGIRILQAMPWRIQLKTVASAIFAGGAEKVMAPAVANNRLLGYKALYKTILEDSKRGMAVAIRAFKDPANYPILVHCIHGKDRTGLIIMLLLMLCKVDPDAIVEDYIMSETVLQDSKLHKELKMDFYLTTDDVLSATKDTMEQTIQYVLDKYGGAADYMREIGLEEKEITIIAENLIKPEEIHTAEPVFKPKASIADALTSLGNKLSIPFGRRSTYDGKPGDKPIVGGPFTNAQGLTSQKSSSLQEEPSRRFSLPNGTDDSRRTVRRASLATTSAAEIRARLNKLRNEHPELGPVTEEPVDFLRPSDSLKKPGPRHTTMQSMDLEGEKSGSREHKWLIPPSLKKTVSLPPSPSPHHAAAALNHTETVKSQLSGSGRSDLTGSLNGVSPIETIHEVKPGVSQNGVGSRALLGNSVPIEEESLPVGREDSIIEKQNVYTGNAPISPFEAK